MSIAATIIALGMMVDNAIVIAESMRNRLQAGEERKAAAIATGRELGLPLLTSTLTTILAFMPIALAEGSAGEYTLSLGQVVILVLLGSWFMSLYMTPTMSYWFLKVTPQPGTAGGGEAALFDSGFYRTYRRFLEAILRHRLVCLLVVLAFLASTIFATRWLANEFFPPNDRNQFLVYVDHAARGIKQRPRWCRISAPWISEIRQSPGSLRGCLAQRRTAASSCRCAGRSTRPARFRSCSWRPGRATGYRLWSSAP
ncbi:MAG: efflux RND transporter permease subunit, partial [Rhodospirillales bacterium]|nr:efflux RND transporter permease subunit [Rhodospirillales bacterium]